MHLHVSGKQINIGGTIRDRVGAAAADANGIFAAAAEGFEKPLRRDERRIRNHRHGADGQERA